MTNEFDQDFDFEEEFDDELADFEDFSDDDPDVLVRTAVLQKNSMIALLCIIFMASTSSLRSSWTSLWVQISECTNPIRGDQFSAIPPEKRLRITSTGLIPGLKKEF